jgi:transcriptional regulator with XRE-family HTH domain
MSQRDLADMCGIAQSGLCKIENGRIDNPRRLTKRALSEVLGYEVEELFPKNGRTRNRELRQWAKVVYGEGAS